MIERIIGWVVEDMSWGGALLGLSLALVTMAGSLLVVGVLLVKLPATYFQESHSRTFWTDRHPVIRLVALTSKNVLGAVLVVLGTILSLPGIPGQGMLTILIGLMLLDLPGKRRLERRIVGRPRILRAINRLRKRFGSPPLVLGTRRGEVERMRLAYRARDAAVRNRP